MQRTLTMRAATMSACRPGGLLAIGVGLACAFCVLCAVMLNESREEAARHALAAAADLALVVEHDASQLLETDDLCLQAVISKLNDPAVGKLPPELRQRVLFDCVGASTGMDGFVVLDATGSVIAESGNGLARIANLTGRDDFGAPRQSANAGLYLSHAYRSDPSGDIDTIAVSRQIPRQDASLAGLVVGFVRLDPFRHRLASVNPGAGNSISLMLADGTTLAERPSDKEIIGPDPQANTTRGSRSAAGTVAAAGSVDGVRSWHVVRHATGLPLMVDVVLARQEVYAGWRLRASLFGSLAAMLGAAIVLMAIALSRHLKRRLALEDELQVLACTDSLTGLGNRRAFDDTAQTEWDRARRQRRPLSVLVIDVDHFKGFNDRYGHSAGDGALAAVARCIHASLQRPGDAAMRYGGEEFAVLLPDTDLHGAAHVAERIRASVQQRALQHADSAHGVLTVSIGLACSEQGDYRQFRAMVDAADAALYGAKGSGRNQVTHRPAPRPSAEDLTPAGYGAMPSPGLMDCHGSMA
jgi:diguanylate cyclase (GGDEF)-like protein